MLLLAIGNQRIIVAGIAAIVTLTAADRCRSTATDFLQTKVNPPLRNLVHILD